MSNSSPGSPITDRDLLFGILAVQMNFVSRDQLMTAIHARVLDKHLPLGELLLKSGALTPERHALLDALTTEHLLGHGGDTRRSLAAIRQSCTRTDLLQSLSDAGVDRIMEAIEAEPASEVPSPTGTGLRFLVLRPHVRGGLGVVSVARDVELSREVALKEMQAELAYDDASRERFLREAEVTGGLEHPGIVPVYGLGRYADGRPYYAMRFIRGETFQDAIKKLHSGHPGYTLRGLLTRFVAVCNAIAYAHDRGVIHRDLKPTNVMLGPFGETLVVDWGLAKSVARLAESKGDKLSVVALKASSANGLATQPGSLLGTPQYMSPEQARGEVDRLGPETDVYSLGATLYCLLTGGSPVQSANPSEVLQRVVQGHWPAPVKSRPSVPAALNAVCCKAMALRPEDRYPSPTALAADLERWLADEPVTAYREPWNIQAGRWIKRHRQVVTAAIALLVAAVPLSLIIAVNREEALRQSERDKQTIRAEKENAESQRELAEANEKTANERKAETEAVLTFVENRVFAAARPEGAPDDPGLGKDVTLRRAVENALPFVEHSFSQRPLIEARLRMTIGTSYWFLGEPKLAVDQWQAANAIYVRLLGKDHPDTLRSTTDLAGGYALSGRKAEALKLREDTLARQRATLGVDHPDTLTSMHSLANSYASFGRQAEALKLREETLERRKGILGRDHADTLRSMNALGTSYGSLGRWAAAASVYEETLALRKAKFGANELGIVSSMNNLGNAYFALGKFTDAAKLYEEGLALRRAKLGPQHIETLRSANNLANTYQELGRLVEARKLHEQTLAIRKATLGLDHAETLHSMESLATVLRKIGLHSDALQIEEELLPKSRITFGPDDVRTLTILEGMAEDFQLMGRHDEAVRHLEDTLARTKAKFGPSHADAARLTYKLACYEAQWIAKSPDRAKQTEVTMDRLKKAVSVGFKNVEQLEKDPSFDAVRDKEEFRNLVTALRANVR
jgi:tetratricopeptide (TPR) repeat protein/tRNA A-37 threonylcarbamoyl transferase component Bud32